MKRIFPLIWLFAIALCSCQRNDFDDETNPNPETKGYNIQLDLPDQIEVVATRSAADDARESGVNKLDLLFFTSTGSDEGTFHSAISTTEIVHINGQGRAKVLLPYTEGGGEAANTFVVVALANSSYSKSALETLLSGVTVAQAKGMLTVESKLSMPASGIGMAGMSTPATVLLRSATDDINLTLRRAVARFDVDATTTAVANKFTLMTAEVRNANDRGYLFPDPTGSGALTHIPTNAQRVNYIRSSNDDRDENAAIPGTWLNRITQKLYAYESVTPTEIADQTTCLIIGGYYTGTDGVPQFGYYRLNIGYKEGVNWNYSVQRNFIYKATITNVTGPGYPTKDDAYNGTGQNVKFDISVWNTRDMAGLVFDGVRAMGISHTLIEVDRNSRNRQFEVKVTTANLGMDEWTITPPAVSWLKTDLATDVVKYENGGTFKITIMEDLTGNIPQRDARYEIKSIKGGMKLTLVVRQTASSGVGLSVTPSIITAGRVGFPEYTGGTLVKGQKIQFTTSGILDIANATYGIVAVGSTADWCRVKRMDGTAIDADEPLLISNSFVVEIDPLSNESTARQGYLQLRFVHDGVLSEFMIQVRQTATIPIVQLNSSVLRVINTGGYNNVMIKFPMECNVPVDIFWGGWTASDFFGNYLPPTALKAGIYGADQMQSSVASASNLVRKTIFEFREQGVPDKILASLFIYVPAQGGANFTGKYEIGKYPLCYNRRLISQYYLREVELGTGSASGLLAVIGYHWGRANVAEGSHNFDPTVWNAGTEQNPIKGSADPCPMGWRMMTRTEYAELVARQAFLTAEAEDTKAGMLSFKNHLNVNINYPLMKREWTSYYSPTDGGTVCYYDRATNTLVDVKTADVPPAFTDDQRKSEWGGVRCIME